MVLGMKKGWVVLGFVVVVFTSVGFWLYHLPEPPVQKLDEARQSISEAQKAHSGKYSSKLFNEAVAAYDSAMFLWGIENNRFFVFRRYEQVALLADKAFQKANLAKQRSIHNMADFEKRLGVKIAETKHLLTLFDRNFGHIPIPETLKKKEAKARMLFGEGQIAFDKREYMTGAPKIDNAAEDIRTVFMYCKGKMTKYFDHYQKWVKMANYAIDESKRKKTTLILVDKMAGKCYLYQSGVNKITWDAELGKNWIGDKNRQGDKATPEGHYKVIQKKAGKNTIYYKALLINYPNDEDKQRFSLARKNGDIPRSAGIGNNIEIHGGGGKGIHWTDGCVALTNSDMDAIFNHVHVGTPVTIVGSLKPFDEVFDLSGL
jgi:L,D-peptidoglycan transpeptidase YkuD (ErfK/YbiS/YcfS/YnhG family)